MLENKVAINQNKRIRGATKREFRKSSTHKTWLRDTQSQRRKADEIPFILPKNVFDVSFPPLKVPTLHLCSHIVFKTFVYDIS